MVLVVSNDEYNKGLDCITIPFTLTAYRTAIPFGEGFIKTDVLQTIDQSLILKIVGCVPEEVFAQVKENILKNC
jgi:hypothetical protein